MSGGTNPNYQCISGREQERYEILDDDQVRQKGYRFEIFGPIADAPNGGIELQAIRVENVNLQRIIPVSGSNHDQSSHYFRCWTLRTIDIAMNYRRSLHHIPFSSLLI